MCLEKEVYEAVRMMQKVQGRPKDVGVTWNMEHKLQALRRDS